VTYGRGVVTLVTALAGEMERRERPDFIGTFHQLGYSWGIVALEDSDQDYWDIEIPRQMIGAAAAMDPGQRFDAFVVDEAQDFADSWWPALLSSAKSIDDVHLAIFRDDEQAVFKDRAGRPDIDLIPFALDRNLRNAKEIVDVFRPLITTNPRALADEGLGVEFVPCSREDVIRTADDVVEDLFDQRGWLPDDIALLTTVHRHDIQKEKDHDKDAYWASLWDNDVFHGTVAGFKGLERPAVVLAVDGFHPGVNPAQVIYVGMSRARDLLIVVGDPEEVEVAVGPAVMKRLLERLR
jgi:superfamily I DNA/RNA helicase